MRNSIYKKFYFLIILNILALFIKTIIQNTELSYKYTDKYILRLFFSDFYLKLTSIIHTQVFARDLLEHIYLRSNSCFNFNLLLQSKFKLN